VAHAQQAYRLPAPRLEARTQKLRGGYVLDVDPSMRVAGERVGREGHQLLDAHPRIALNPDEVVGKVVRVPRGVQDRAVRPRLEHVANRPLLGVMPSVHAVRNRLAS
jgi:hypothetical protein